MEGTNEMRPDRLFLPPFLSGKGGKQTEKKRKEQKQHHLPTKKKKLQQAKKKYKITTNNTKKNNNKTQNHQQPNKRKRTKGEEKNNKKTHTYIHVAKNKKKTSNNKKTQANNQYKQTHRLPKKKEDLGRSRHLVNKLPNPNHRSVLIYPLPHSTHFPLDMPYPREEDERISLPPAHPHPPSLAPLSTETTPQCRYSKPFVPRSPPIQQALIFLSMSPLCMRNTLLCP